MVGTKRLGSYAKGKRTMARQLGINYETERVYVLVRGDQIVKRTVVQGPGGWKQAVSELAPKGDDELYIQVEWKR